MKAPRISIGMPVYNGDKYLVQAIESVLGQTYVDFELIISDNASTDRTQEICQAYAARDQRIYYYRCEKNHGAASNFNRTFHLARGEYFQWLAHDDYLSRHFVERSVSILDEDPSIILCFSWVRMINENGKDIRTYELPHNIGAHEPRIRFHDILLRWHNSFFIFGLIRSSALRKTRLILPHAHGDTVLLTHLSLLGRFYQIPEYLFYSRNHPEQSNKVHEADLPLRYDLIAYSTWFDIQIAKSLRYPYWRILSEYYKTMWHVDLKLIDRIACHLSFARFALRYRYGLLWDLGGPPRRFVRAVSSPKNKSLDGGRIMESQ